MAQRGKILAEILGFRGWRVNDAFFEDAMTGQLVLPLDGIGPLPGARLVIRVARRWAPRCSSCGAICRRSAHEKLPTRRWTDLEWGRWPVAIEYGAVRVKCTSCGANPVEMVPWSEPRQYLTARLQHRLTLEAASMPTSHVAALHGLSWGAVRRAEAAALARWQKTRAEVPLHRIGIDEKWLGRRHKRDEHFVTIVSNLDTGEPVWLGFGRSEATLKGWLDTLSPAEKAAITLAAMDMHAPFKSAIRSVPELNHVVIVHDPFHLMKRAGEAITEVRRAYFFRGGAELRAIGRGTRWLVLRAWERCSPEQRLQLQELIARNPRLGRAYQLLEEFRHLVCHAPDRDAMGIGLVRVFRRTQDRRNVPLRKWHDSLRLHYEQILALAEHRPPAGRIEALNNNWETLIRQGRGYRDYPYLMLKLRFMVANPIRTEGGMLRFLALGMVPPLARAA